jgi:hypothetical protein
MHSKVLMQWSAESDVFDGAETAINLPYLQSRQFNKVGVIVLNH